MRTKTSIILILFFVNLKIANCQHELISGSNDFGFTIGLTEYQVKENVLNNIRHRGMIPSIGISYEKFKEISWQKYEFYLIINALKSRYDPDRATIVINPSFYYRYARKAKNIKENLDLLL